MKDVGGGIADHLLDSHPWQESYIFFSILFKHLFSHRHWEGGFFLVNFHIVIIPHREGEEAHCALENALKGTIVLQQVMMVMMTKTKILRMMMMTTTIALCVDPHCKVSIGQYTKMCTSPSFFPAPLFQMKNI